MKDKAFATCPEDKCQISPWGHGEVKRLLGTGAGLIFKGSGFYITDYRSEGYKKAAKSESGEKKDSKPAEKSAAPATKTSPTTSTTSSTAQSGAGSKT